MSVPRPNGFPSPPRFCCPTRDERFAIRGPPGEGESSAVFFASHRLVSQLGVAASAALLRQKAVAGHLRTPRHCIVPAQEREKRRGLRQLNVAAQMDFEAEFGEHGCFY